MLLSLYDGWRAFTEVHKEIIFSGFLSVKSEVIIRFFRIFEPHLLYVSFVVLQYALLRCRGICIRRGLVSDK